MSFRSFIGVRTAKNNMVCINQILSVATFITDEAGSGYRKDELQLRTPLLGFYHAAPIFL